MLLTFTCLCGCSNGKKEEFASLKQTLETETPYLAQDELEKQLVEQMNEYIYYKDGTGEESALLTYKGQKLDYMMLHQEFWDTKEDTFSFYLVSVILQPQDKQLSSMLVNLIVIDEELYEFQFVEDLGKRLDFSSVEELETELQDLRGMYVAADEAKIWYTGMITVDGAERPEYSDFDGKEARIEEICKWVNGYLKEHEMKMDALIYVSDFRQEDGSTDILLENASEDAGYILLQYDFYGDNDFKLPDELDENKCQTYIKRLKEAAVNK